MPLIGPFFYINGHLIYNACTLAQGRCQADKLDNSCSHEELYEANFTLGDYINYPRGRVIWDCSNSTAIVYIDPCLKTPKILSEVVAAFNLNGYTACEDAHYKCQNCVPENLFAL